MQKWEHKILITEYDPNRHGFYWLEPTYRALPGGETENAMLGHQIMDNSEVEQRLQELGNDGWELVSVAVLPWQGTAHAINYYLKRRVE